MDHSPPKLIDNSKKDGQPATSQWYREKDANLHQFVFPLVREVERIQRGMQTDNQRFLSLYENREKSGFSSSIYLQNALNQRSNNKISLNVVKACIDTACAKIAKNKPKPLFFTDEGDSELQQMAENLTRFVEGLFYAGDVYGKAQAAFLDSCIFGTGILYLYIDEGEKEIRVERVHINELIVDEMDGIYGKPGQIHRRKFTDKQSLIALYPKFEDQIRKSSAEYEVSDTISDQVMVIESWHLPSGKNAKDGKYCVTINNATLCAEPYEKDYFPFVFTRWSPRSYYFYGIGLAEELSAIQEELNQIVRTVSKGLKAVANPQVWVEKGSNIPTQNWSNEIGVRTYTGKPPTTISNTAFNPEVYQYIENWFRKAFEITGISMLSATSRKPVGLESAPALREYNDIETERFVLVGQRYEAFHMDIAKIMIDMSRDLYAKVGNFEVKTVSNKFTKSISWKDADLPSNKFFMKVFPINGLPSTPAGKRQAVIEMIEKGIMPQAYALSLLDYPDLNEFVSLETASLDNWRMMIDEIIVNGTYIPPEPYDDLMLGKKVVRASYIKAKKDKVSETKLQLLRDLMDAIEELIIQATPPQQQPPEQGSPEQMPEEPQE